MNITLITLKLGTVPFYASQKSARKITNTKWHTLFIYIIIRLILTRSYSITTRYAEYCSKIYKARFHSYHHQQTVLWPRSLSKQVDPSAPQKFAPYCIVQTVTSNDLIWPRYSTVQAVPRLRRGFYSSKSETAVSWILILAVPGHWRGFHSEGVMITENRW